MLQNGDRLFVDTNILLCATDRSREQHQAARTVFRDALQQGIHLALSGQILREYLVVATRPVAVNGLGLAPADALHNAAQFRSRCIYIEASERCWSILSHLVHTYGISGKQIHDANVVAVMAAAGIHWLMTENGKDFRAYQEIELVDSRSALAQLQ